MRQDWEPDHLIEVWMPSEGAFFDAAEAVPLEGVVPHQWRAAAVDDKGRVERIPRAVRAGQPA